MLKSVYPLQTDKGYIYLTLTLGWMYLVPSKILHVTETSLVVQGLDHSQCKGSFWIVVLEKALESPLDWKEIEPVNPKGNQPWIFVGRINAETEAPLLWLPDAKSWLNRENPDAGEGWRQKKGTGEDEMVGWHHWLNGHEFEQVPGVGDRQGSQMYCCPWGHKELNMTDLPLEKSVFRSRSNS